MYSNKKILMIMKNKNENKNLKLEMKLKIQLRVQLIAKFCYNIKIYNQYIAFNWLSNQIRFFKKEFLRCLEI